MIDQLKATDRLRARAVDGGPIAVVCPALLALTAGLGGGAVGLGGVALWLVSPIYAFALTQLGVLLAVPADLSVVETILLEAGLLALLAAEGVVAFESRRTVAALLGLMGVLAGLTVAALIAGVAHGVAAVGVVAGFGLSSYLLHRYELVQLGKV